MSRNRIFKESSSFLLACLPPFLFFPLICSSYRIRIWPWEQNIKVQNEHSKGSGRSLLLKIYRNRLYFLLKNQWWNFCLWFQGLIKIEILLNKQQHREDKNILWPILIGPALSYNNIVGLRSGKCHWWNYWLALGSSGSWTA